MKFFMKYAIGCFVLVFLLSCEMPEEYSQNLEGTFYQYSTYEKAITDKRLDMDGSTFEISENGTVIMSGTIVSCDNPDEYGMDEIDALFIVDSPFYVGSVRVSTIIMNYVISGYGSNPDTLITSTRYVNESDLTDHYSDTIFSNSGGRLDTGNNWFKSE